MTPEEEKRVSDFIFGEFMRVRNEALEEAARKVESFAPDYPTATVAAAIRALKSD